MYYEHNINRILSVVEMKTINAKRIAAVAASLLMGLAFAGTGGVTWNNIPIINNQGQPVVQVVVGSQAQPSDGVVAANIAAVLGNLAFTSVNVTATASSSSLAKVHCVVTTPTCTLTNQQVWFNQKGFSAPSGTYAFTALIGSVFNGGITLGSPTTTKSISTSTTYGFLGTVSTPGLQTSPQASPYSTSSSGAPQTVSFSASSNGGGLSTSQFGSSNFRAPSTGVDNLLLVTSSNLPSLLNNYGTYGESVQLWFTGEPVFDQSTSPAVNNFAVFGASGAYQVKFSKPIPYRTGGNSINNAQINFLGKNWTILNYKLPTSGGGATSNWNTATGAAATVSSSNGINGGALSLASTLTPVQTVYVGHNVSSGGFTVSLTDLGQPNSGGVSQASVNVYYNGTLTNTTQLSPGNTTKFTALNGQKTVFVKVNQTFAGLYAYQKWAKLQLYSNIMNITDGQSLNQTNAPAFKTSLWWTNATGTAGIDNELASIIVINASPNPNPLLPGQSFTIATPNMTAYALTFVGHTLGTNYDPVTFTLGTQSLTYQNTNVGKTGNGLGNIANITNTEPSPILTVQSQVPSAFSYAGQVGSTLTYDLEPYQLVEVANGVVANSLTSTGAAAPGTLGVNVVLTSTAGDSNVITPTNPLSVTVYGYSSSSQLGGTNTVATNTVTFYGLGNAALGATNSLSLGENLYNVTGIQFSRVVPGLTANVVAVSSAGPQTWNTLAQLALASSPQLLYYQASGQSNYRITSGASVNYNQQNGQPIEYFNLTGVTPANLQGSHAYFTYKITEYPVPGITSPTNDLLEVGIYNSSTGVGAAPYFQLNTSVGGQKNNATYVSTQFNQVNAPVGFYTERGSKVASISPSSVTLDLAKAVDTLQFTVGPVSTSPATSNSVTSSSVGPVGVGQSVPGYVNLTVSKVNATCTFTSTSCSVTGLSNLTATPSVTQATVPVYLHTERQPLVVLDSNANSAATLIVVGSKYVNSVAGQVFAQNPSLNSSFGTSSVVASAEGTNRILVAGYTANQTVQAGNQFIQQLLQAAGVANP